MNEKDIQELRGKFRGELITPADAGYDAARKVYNGMIDRRPALIAKCADVADVIAASASPARRSCSSRCAGAGTTGRASASATAGSWSTCRG